MAQPVAPFAPVATDKGSSPLGGGQRELLATRGWRLKDTPAAWLLIAPVLILFGIAVVYPLI
ncbi:MAG: raffinose/stachyose/melibiose transport system permease protein, partial [Devosia sp.]